MPAGPHHAAAATPEIVIDAIDPDTMALWRTVAKVAQALEDQHMRWCLVGGLMVALYAIEAGQISRPHRDRHHRHRRPAHPAASPHLDRGDPAQGPQHPPRVHSRPDDQREDLIVLLGLLTDPRSVIETLTKAERKWLRAIETTLDLGDRDLTPPSIPHGCASRVPPTAC